MGALFSVHMTIQTNVPDRSNESGTLSGLLNLSILKAIATGNTKVEKYDSAGVRAANSKVRGLDITELEVLINILFKII